MKVISGNLSFPHGKSQFLSQNTVTFEIHLCENFYLFLYSTTGTKPSAQASILWQVHHC